jgi:hypothetical protein
MNYLTISQNERQFQALTSLSVLEFEHLLSYFSLEWEKYYRYHTLEGKKRAFVQYQEHKSAVLQSTPQKLFFLLVYMKTNSLQEHQAASFGVSQSKVSKIYRILLSVLNTTLHKMGLLPCRDSESLKIKLADHHIKVFGYDGTEMPIQRNHDEQAQTIEFSGKKHAHRLKNLVLCDVFQQIVYLSPTEEGIMHDKAIADLYPLNMPVGSVIKQDLGFAGHQPKNCVVEMPFKKPKGKELTVSQQIYNQLFNPTRAFAEHANSGLKRLRMLKDILRIKDAEVRDMIRGVAAALHNLRVSSMDPIRKYQSSAHLQVYLSHLRA